MSPEKPFKGVGLSCFQSNRVQNLILNCSKEGLVSCAIQINTPRLKKWSKIITFTGWKYKTYWPCSNMFNNVKHRVTSVTYSTDSLTNRVNNFSMVFLASAIHSSRYNNTSSQTSPKNARISKGFTRVLSVFNGF